MKITYEVAGMDWARLSWIMNWWRELATILKISTASTFKLCYRAVKLLFPTICFVHVCQSELKLTDSCYFTSVSQSVSQSVRQAGRQAVSQSVSQSINQSIFSQWGNQKHVTGAVGSWYRPHFTGPRNSKTGSSHSENPSNVFRLHCAKGNQKRNNHRSFSWFVF